MKKRLNWKIGRQLSLAWAYRTIRPGVKLFMASRIPVTPQCSPRQSEWPQHGTLQWFSKWAPSSLTKLGQNSTRHSEKGIIEFSTASPSGRLTSTSSGTHDGDADRKPTGRTHS